MWQIENYTPYRAHGTIVVDVNGAKHWVVSVRGTFSVDRNGRVDVAEEQSDPLLLPKYRGKDGESSLEYEADAIAEKPFVDVLVNGSAFAPRGKPVTQVTVGLRASSIQKQLVVTGERVWERKVTGNIAPSDPKPFVEMPITYERAFGGFDKTDPDPTRQKMFAPNPVGTGVYVDRGYLLGKPAANVEYPGVEPGAKGAAGLGPICSYWAPRAKYAGTYDGKWVETRKPLLPLDFDVRFFNCAPEDQQIRGHYMGGDRIDVVNMSPEGTFGFVVPKVVMGFNTYFSKGAGPRSVEHHRSSLKTIIVEPTERRFIMVWQSTLSCHSRIEDIDETTVREKEVIR